MISHFFASSSIALEIQMRLKLKLCYLPCNNTRFESSRRVRSCEKISQVALAAFPMTSFLTQRIWFEQTHAIFIYYFSNSFVAAAFYVCFSFPFYSLNSYRKSFFLYYELYAFPFFNLFFMYRGKFFETFFILLLAASSNLRRKEDSKCSLDQVHFHTFFITKFLGNFSVLTSLLSF